MNQYRFISCNPDSFHAGVITARIQAVKEGMITELPVRELYHPDWLRLFSPADASRIAALHAAEQTQDIELLTRLHHIKPAVKDSVILVGTLFTAFLILSNLAAFKLVSVGHFTFPAGLVFFPVTYLFDDILTEVYGFKISRRIIWSALFANLIVLLGAWLTTYLPPSPDWHDQAAYALIYQATPRIFIASTVAYFFGEFSNSILLAKLKILMSGRHLWLRALASTSVGVGIDTILFTHIAFFSLIPYSAVWDIIFTMYLAKVIYEACAIPLTYKMANYLKRKDNVDYYDVGTRFNPFSLAL
ncbi:hypothetical protein AQUSIP_23210 [Aquicella siphonis]|uniref:Probable queuosine precursor transporter n=1 Tax=Aquicella siphonis TaxID=254247 RepID=A0A5E4PJ49_9COXI|nr:queuosine precursor transporter [Aquicella siphonis]VVC76994.1 hypothetical protein AQUSIP_23210 [Aquicella siphonis]